MKHAKEFGHFTDVLFKRLEAGEREYGDVSFQRPMGELVDEVCEELLDVCGWSFVMWCRLQERKAKCD